jgi:hypothetical protein
VPWLPVLSHMTDLTQIGAPALVPILDHEVAGYEALAPGA